ncbi:hypothetical protein [Pseudomonas sp. PS02290]|uniref:hypothetical protein n=1 Tax=Pseudomonas sp. PS02290 TaxID=2991430 RepID=UPI00249CDA0F|nr:hypothetical protein [Pseudomonas sp. PS02290]
MTDLPESGKHHPELMEVDLDWIDKIESTYKMPNFGVGAASLKAVAWMIVKDMWVMGDLVVDCLEEEFDGDENSPEFLVALKSTHDVFVERLERSIQRGHLKTVLTIRDFDDNIDAGRTYVDGHELMCWLEDRGYSAGDHIESWMEGEEKISQKLSEESLFLRTSNKDPSTMTFLSRSRVEDGEKDIEKIMTAYKSVLIENQVLKEKIEHLNRQSKKPEPEMNAKSRTTLLLAIGAICNEFNVSLDNRKFAPKITEMVERLGVKVDPKPFRDLPPMINEAIARRKS